METNKNGGLFLVGLALGLGALGDVLFRNADWGINVAAWLIAVFGAVVSMRRRFEYAPLSRYVWVAVALSVLAVFRESMFLKIITTIALLAAIAFSTLPSTLAERLKQTVFTFVGRMADTLIASVTVLTTHLPSLVPSGSADIPIPSPSFIRVVRSAAISIVALLLFGSLLVSADAVFERLVFNAFDIDVETALSHTGWSFFYAWLGCTVLFVLTAGQKPILGVPRGEERTSGYAVEINSMLTTINVLFTVFIIVQAGYFFGGHDHILQDTGPSYAEYARRGFFEIAAIAAIAFVMMLICDALIPSAATAGRRVFHVSMQLHVALIGVLIASAFHRLMLYVNAYGLTELRFYVATAICWIALAFVLLAYAILQSKRSALPRMLVNTLFAAVFALYAINPASIVVRTNVSRANAPERFDIEYALSMSADAVPALVGELSRLTPEQRTEIESGLAEQWGDRDREIRDWNLSRWLAVRAVRRIAE